MQVSEDHFPLHGADRLLLLWAEQMALGAFPAYSAGQLPGNYLLQPAQLKDGSSSSPVERVW